MRHWYRITKGHYRGKYIYARYVTYDSTATYRNVAAEQEQNNTAQGGPATPTQQPEKTLKAGIEVSGLYIRQANDAHTFTALPMLDLRIAHEGHFDLIFQPGITYIKTSIPSRIWAGVFRLAPAWHFGNGPISLEIPMGIQWWQTVGIKADLNGRLVFATPFAKIFDDFFLGGGWISNEYATTVSFDAGVRKWF
jgi:hypothetical protein